MTDVDLRAIRSSLHGVIPSPIATCSADGMPNVTYLSLVAYVDAERVATSRQFLGKTRANLDENPRAQVVVMDPGSGEQHELDLRYLHTEVEGETFESLRANLDAVASQTGMGDIFRLRGVDVYRVERCTRIGVAAAPAPAQRDLLEPVERVVRRLVACVSYEEVARVALEALDDQLGLSHTLLLAHDAASEGLFAVASSGYPASAVGAEVALGDGLIGTAGVRRRIVIDSNMRRSATMASAVTQLAPDPREVQLPRLAAAASAAAVPLVVGDDLVGVLYAESERIAAFVGPWEPALRLVGAHLAAALAARGMPAEDPAPAAPPPPAPAGAELEVTYYESDDTVLVDGEYVVKGVPGRILRSLLREHEASGRTLFSNRELRLDESLGLPAGNDNLEARLLVLRRRLAERGMPIALTRVGRGRLELSVQRPLRLVDVPTAGPWRDA